MALYRHEAKTHNRYHLGASFDLGFTRIKKELEAPRPKNLFLVKFVFYVKIHLYHPKGGLLCYIAISSHLLLSPGTQKVPTEVQRGPLLPPPRRK